MKLIVYRILILMLLSTGLSLPSHAADAVVPETINTDPTFVHMGLRWQISGDDDLDAICKLRYRRTGSQQWLVGMDLMRTHLNLHGEAADRAENRFAGSAFFLKPNTTYDFELTLIDPDGGDTTQVVTAATAKPLAVADVVDELYVIPGNGGGSGTQADPFKGLQAACDAAAQGAVIHIAAGNYNPCDLTASGDPGNPIVLRGPVDPHVESDETLWAIIDGVDTHRGVLTIGTNNTRTAYLIIEQMVIQNGRWGIDAQNTHHIAVRNNLIRDVGWGYYNRRENGWEGWQHISDNTLVGRTAWPGSGIPSEQGIDLNGSNNVVCYNRVMNFGDGISVQPSIQAYGYANDIYGNDISEIVDDPIEIDYNSCNTRVWRNRVVNGRMGVSLAPIYGGPAYIFRNEFFNMDYSAYKMNREPAGLVIVHNTSAKLRNGTSSPAGWQNTLLRNNVIIGTRYVFEEYGLVAGSTDDWDYDALGTTDDYFAKWNDTAYETFRELRDNSGVEAHAVEISLRDLQDATLPTDYGDGIAVGSYDLRLKAGVAAVNAGQALPNINDPFVSDGQPDCGAFELGQPLPEYGPGTGRYEPGDDPPDDSGDPPGDPGNDTGSGSSNGGGCYLQSISGMGK